MSFKLLLSQLGLHVLLPLTSYDLYSQILSVYEHSINYGQLADANSPTYKIELRRRRVGPQSNTTY